MPDTTIEIPLTTQDLSRLETILTAKSIDSAQFLHEAINLFRARSRAERFAAITATGQRATRETFGRDLTPEEIAQRTREGMSQS